MLVAKLFGPPCFFYRDREVLFPSRKVLALFCYLLVEGRVSREKAAGLLWSERNEEAAHKNLRNALYLLKKPFPMALSFQTGSGFPSRPATKSKQTWKSSTASKR